jgi:hypothetical protein
MKFAAQTAEGGCLCRILMFLLCATPPFEPLIQANFRSQAHLYLTADTLPTWGNGGYIPFALLTADLHLANTGNVNPFPAGDFLCQCFQITFYRLTDEFLGQAAALPGNMRDTLCMIHDCSPQNW